MLKHGQDTDSYRCLLTLGLNGPNYANCTCRYICRDICAHSMRLHLQNHSSATVLTSSKIIFSSSVVSLHLISYQPARTVFWELFLFLHEHVIEIEIHGWTRQRLDTEQMILFSASSEFTPICKSWNPRITLTMLFSFCLVMKCSVTSGRCCTDVQELASRQQQQVDPDSNNPEIWGILGGSIWMTSESVHLGLQMFRGLQMFSRLI